MNKKLQYNVKCTKQAINSSSSTVMLLRILIFVHVNTPVLHFCTCKYITFCIAYSLCAIHVIITAIKLLQRTHWYKQTHCYNSVIYLQLSLSIALCKHFCREAKVISPTFRHPFICFFFWYWQC